MARSARRATLRNHSPSALERHPMTHRNRSMAWFVATVIAGTTCLVAAQPQQAPATTPQTATLSQSIPVDPEISVGRFPNGLRYYVRANAKPEKRAELRLVVKAGSILEDDDQLGLAH